MSKNIDDVVSDKLSKNKFIDGYSYPHKDKNGNFFVGLSVHGKPSGGIIFCGTREVMFECVNILKKRFEVDTAQFKRGEK